jgi:hypothetical protein
MRQQFLGISAAVLFSAAGIVAAQTPPSEQVQSAVNKPVETATQPDPGTKMRLAAMDTSPNAFHKLHKDNDGRISALEAADNPKVAAAFTMADKDKDGYLSKEEFEAMNPASPNSMMETDASSPSGDRATAPGGDHASDPSGDQPATGPNEPTPNDNSPSPRRVARPPRHEKRGPQKLKTLVRNRMKAAPIGPQVEVMLAATESARLAESRSIPAPGPATTQPPAQNQPQ